MLTNWMSRTLFKSMFYKTAPKFSLHRWISLKVPNCHFIFAALDLVKEYRVSQKRTDKTITNVQTCQACQHSKVVQRGPKRSEMVNLDVFDHLGIGTLLGPCGLFWTISNEKWFFCSKALLPNPTLSLWGNKLIVWNGPRGSQIVKNI